MSMRLLAGAAVVALAASAHAQAPAPDAQAKPGQAAAPTGGAGPQAPLRVTVVISRHQGDKRLSSLPYVLGVAPGKPTTLRMGVDVPIVVPAFTGSEKGSPPVPMRSYQYRSVGANIDCRADAVSNGLYNLALTVEDSSVQLQHDRQSGTQSVPDVPSFRTFKSSFTAVMRDGQTAQYTSATDPVSGEVMRIDVTLNLMR
jgi:hypothetical protein